MKKYVWNLAMIFGGFLISFEIVECYIPITLSLRRKLEYKYYHHIL